MDKRELKDRIYDKAVNNRRYLENLVSAYVDGLSEEDLKDEIAANTYDDDDDDDPAVCFICDGPLTPDSDGLTHCAACGLDYAEDEE